MSLFVPKCPLEKGTVIDYTGYREVRLPGRTSFFVEFLPPQRARIQTAAGCRTQMQAFRPASSGSETDFQQCGPFPQNPGFSTGNGVKMLPDTFCKPACGAGLRVLPTPPPGAGACERECFPGEKRSNSLESLRGLQVCLPVKFLCRMTSRRSRWGGVPCQEGKGLKSCAV